MKLKVKVLFAMIGGLLAALPADARARDGSSGDPASSGGTDAEESAAEDAEAPPSGAARAGETRDGSSGDPASSGGTDAEESAAEDAETAPAETIDLYGSAPSTEEILERSAEAVEVVDTEEARLESADLGEVLARTEGVGVRRSGGLGAGERLSLAGLGGSQVPRFVDGIPIGMTGFALGLANVPVNLVERVEMYRGVVPIRFGADALGGAFNVVTTPESRTTGGSASYQVGSFGTHRVTGGGQYSHEASGAFARAYGFGDVARNDYEVDVEVANERGQLEPATVERFHDGYRAAGGGLELGVARRPWADVLAARAYVTELDKELQHNRVMTVPYGEVTYGESRAGGTARYEHALSPELELGARLGYGYTRTRFTDVGEWVYNWRGDRIRERRRAGELQARPRDQLHWEHGALARLNLAWTPSRDHELRLSAAPTFTTRTGDEREQVEPDARDPLTAQRDLFTLVTGVAHRWGAFDDRVENIAFAKDYLYVARTEEALPGDVFQRRDRDVHRAGVGDGVRVYLADWIYAKASYEWATRLPSPTEVFGDGVFVTSNLELEPETSHNLNLGAAVVSSPTPVGAFRGELAGFARLANELIVLLGDDSILSYRNVLSARSLGAEVSAGWSSPGDYVTLQGNATWQDFRNTSDEGAFADFAGDRIPNRPYLFANGSARAALGDLVVPRDELTVAWHSRYVHGFFRSWESVGQRDLKQTVPSQLLHSVSLGYRLRGAPSVSGTIEVQNLTDTKVFDFFGVQRPGRALYVKMTAAL